MKKIVSFALFIFILILATLTYATDVPNNGYAFNLSYQGEIKKNVQKDATVTLSGTNATPYTNVRIKIDLISGPATPELLATDSAGTTYNLAQIGYWGPESGFAVGGTFTNETPIKATYPEAGTYVSRLSLIDLNNSNAVITSKEFTVTVTDDSQVIENVENITNVQNNVIEEMPQTGVSIWTYIVVAVVLIVTILYARKLINKSK